MKLCVSCETVKPDDEMYSPTWCHECVLRTLDEQSREDTPKVRKQTFLT